MVSDGFEPTKQNILTTQKNVLGESTPEADVVCNKNTGMTGGGGGG